MTNQNRPVMMYPNNNYVSTSASSLSSLPVSGMNIMATSSYSLTVDHKNQK